MRYKTALLCVAVAAAATAAAPMKLQFTKGETLRYRVSVESTETTSVNGDTVELNMKGSHVMTMKVSSIASGVATMTVGYSGATASAKALSLPPEARKDKDKIEQQAAAVMKAALSSGARSQKVRSTGAATYTLAAGEGQSLTIEGGAFMMLVLPTGEPALNKPWTVNIRQPMPGAPALPCTFKWVGTLEKNGRSLRKILVSMSKSGSNKQGEVSITANETASGHILFDTARGKVMEGEIERTVKQTLKHEKEGTRTQTQVSKQSFVKF